MSPTPPQPSGDDRHRRLTELFARATELEGAARAAFLGELGREDPGLHDELLALLDVDAGGDDWLEPGSASLAQQLAAPQRQKGERIGAYVVEELIGSGGAGDVYLARQQRPQRLVAIKVMRQGLVEPSRVRKFEFEAQLLARLQHPGIAQVFEADVFEDRDRRKPFFVMEYVERAATITAYADRERLNTRQRLELFAAVCEAVEHGHHHGIAHCDLKPENLLVPPSGNAKVIDFGIARVSDGDPGMTTHGTGHYALAGTLPYMSPEQARGDAGALDVRTDVYSLGVICYELLAGALPLAVDGLSLPTAIHRIATMEPTPLSSHCSALRGDLETIVGKCLEKDRERRYEDAGALLRDVRHFLADEPILARRPTLLYQVHKFTRRHRGFVLGSALAVLSLFVGAAIAIQQAIVATRGEIDSRWRAYRASIAAAGAAIANHDVAQARANLESAPEEHRNWEWEHLRVRLDDSLRSFEVAGDGMLGRPFFTEVEGRAAVGVWRGGVVSYFDQETGALLRTREVERVAVDGDSGVVAEIVNARLTVRSADATRSWPLEEFAVPTGACDALEVARGGRFVALAGPTRAVVIDVLTSAWRAIAVDRGGFGVTSLAVSQHGDVVLAAAAAGRAGIWRQGRERLDELDDVATFVRSVAFAPDGRSIAMGLHDTTIGLWDAESGARTMRADGHRHAVTGIAFSPGGRLVLSTSLDRTMRVWQTEGLAPLAVQQGHERGVREVVMDAAGALIATSGEDGTVRLWDGRRAADRGELTGHEQLVFPVAFSSDGELLASAGTDGTARIWATATHEAVAAIPVPLPVVTALAFSHDRGRLAVGGPEGCVAFDLRRGARLAADATPPVDGAVRDLVFAADGVRVLLPQLREDRTLRAWNTDTGALESAPLSALVDARSRHVSPTGRWLVLPLPHSAVGRAASADSDSASRIVVFDLSSNEPVALPELSGAFAWVPGSTHLAARLGDDSKRFAVFDVATARRVASIDGHSDRIYGMACAPDGSRLVTCGRDAVRLWSVGYPGRVGDRIVELEGHTSFVWSVAWSPDGRQVATGSGDRSVRLWGVRRALDVQVDRARGEHTFAELAAHVWR